MAVDTDLEFTKALQERGVKLIDKEGKATRYILREMPHTVRCEYLDAIHKDNLEVDRNSGVQLVKKFQGLSEAILTRAMFHENGKAVTLEEINNLGVGTSVIADLAEECKKLSGLISREELKAKAKN